MKFNFKEMVALAAKGYKPNDIAEMTALDDSKYSKDDVLSLVANGYSKSEIKKLVETVEQTDKPQENETDETEDHSNNEETGSQSQDDGGDSSDNVDDIDYKKLYEDEKKLRQKLQHDNVNGSNSGDETDTRTDEQIAVDVIRTILGG